MKKLVETTVCDSCGSFADSTEAGSVQLPRMSPKPIDLCCKCLKSAQKSGFEVVLTIAKTEERAPRSTGRWSRKAQPTPEGWTEVDDSTFTHPSGARVERRGPAQWFGIRADGRELSSSSNRGRAFQLALGVSTWAVKQKIEIETPKVDVSTVPEVTEYQETIDRDAALRAAKARFEENRKNGRFANNGFFAK